MLADLREFGFQVRNALAEFAAVVFDLFFAAAARPGHAAALTRQVRPCSGQARQEILAPGELDLKHRLASTRARRKNVQDDLLAVDHFQLEELFQIALLRGAQRHVEDHDVCLRRLRRVADLLGLAAPDVILRVRGLQSGHDLSDHRDFERMNELRELLQIVRGRRRIGWMDARTHEVRPEDVLPVVLIGPVGHGLRHG